MQTFKKILRYSLLLLLSSIIGLSAAGVFGLISEYRTMNIRLIGLEYEACRSRAIHCKMLGGTVPQCKATAVNCINLVNKLNPPRSK